MPVGSDTTATTPASNPVSILDHFADLPDPRREQGRIHRLDEIVFIAICAVFCGADTWVQIADYGHSKRDWLETFLKEYSEAAGSMCQDGKYVGCEVAEGAQGALQALKTARAECKSGNKSSCDRVARMVPQIAAQTTDVCPVFQLKDCPKVPVLTGGPEDNSTTPPPGYFDYQGQELPGYVPSTSSTRP